MAISPTHLEQWGGQSGRSRIGRLMGFQVVGVGSYVPDNVVRNEDLAQKGYDADWILQRTGIEARRHALPEQATSDLAVEACRRCIEGAETDPADIDLCLVGTYTPDFPMPATAAIVQDRLGLRALAFDIEAACSSFAFALITGGQFVASGCSRRALVVGADCNTRIVAPSDMKTFPIFGDGAGAVLLAPADEDRGLLAYAVGSEGSGAGLLYRPMGGTRIPIATAQPDDPRQFLQMDGRPVFKWAVRAVAESTAEVVQAAELALDDVDLFVFHQANLRIISAAVEALGIDPRKVYNNLQRYGNTSSASIPLVLDEARAEGLIEPGKLVLFSGFGGGLSWGTGLLRW